jgi:Mg2+ and Co2+ transporter CorA
MIETLRFRYMPGLVWRYGYFGALGGMLILGMGLLTPFKRKHWL